MFEFLKRLFGVGAAQQRRVAPRAADILPGTLGLGELSRRLGGDLAVLQRLPITYGEFAVPKRSGGTRRILAPSPELKAVQRRILHALLARLHAHPCATGFERGQSIATNAAWHVGQEVVIKLDLKDFFASTTAVRVERYLHGIGWDADAAALLVRLCTYEGRLPQGAPTSPRLSNLVNVELDTRLAALAKWFQMGYTRYADDITFSGPAAAPAPHRNPRTLEPLGGDLRVNSIITWTKGIVAEYGYTLHVHKKLRVARRHDRQVVTGLVVNDKVQLPRATRRRLRAIRHRMARTGLSTLTQEQLDGWTALEDMIAEQASR